MKSFFFAIVAIAFIMSMPSIYADTILGKNYNDELISSVNGIETHRWTSHPERIFDGGYYVDYKLYQNSTIIQLETANSGSLVFNKSACSYNMYEPGFVSGNDPKVSGISWTVKGKSNSTSAWSSVNSINNAVCNVSVSTTVTDVSIIATKSSTAGTFQIVLDYSPGMGIKETMRAYNNNPAWNNHNIGFTEKFQVPRIIHFGNNTFDLSNYNNTIYDRDWIETHNSKLLKLSEKVFYDFGIGYDSLNDIKITWDGSRAWLSLNYLYPVGIVPYQEWFEVDPTFGPANDVSYLLDTTDGASAACPGAPYTSAAATGQARKSDASDAGDGCQRAIAAWNIVTLPVGLTVIDVDAEFTSSAAVNMGTETCDSFRVMNDPATAAAATLWNDAQDGSQYVTANTNCQTASTYSLDLGATADSDIQASRAAGNTTFAISVKLTDEVRDAGTSHSISFVNTAIDLTVVYTIGPPNSITTLAETDHDTNSVDLSWTAPNLNGGTLQRYMLNYTTPCGIPLTALPNGTTATSYTVSSLTAATCYSFRATAATEGGKNVTGANIINVTTPAFNQANFTVGNLSFEAENDDVIPIFFERDDISDTSLFLNVTYPDTWELACDFHYKFAMTNRTYANLTFVTIDADQIESSFQFNNVDREIINVFCWNQNGTGEGTYLITQSQFPLLEFIQSFDTGKYGTEGNFGSMDFVYLAVIIVSLVGLNRTNESVGAGFMIVITAAMAYFEFITIPTAAISGLALMVMLIIITTRKD